MKKSIIAIFASFVFIIETSMFIHAAPSVVTVTDMANFAIPELNSSESEIDNDYISDENEKIDDTEITRSANAGIYPGVNNELDSSGIISEDIENDGSALESAAAQLLSDSIQDTLISGFATLAEEIDVSSFGLTTSNKQELCDIYGDVLRADPKLYYVSFNFKYRYNSKKLITKILPQYTTTNTDEIELIQSRVDARINEIAGLTNDSMSDIEKLLVIYNEIILTSNYDNTLVRRTGMDILLHGESVCQGYASAMHAVADRVGIEGCFVRSEEMNHVWNAFLIDGDWYHLDATCGDPYEKYSTKISYAAFLKSNDWFLDELGYTGFTNLDSTSTTYDEFFWNNTTSPVVFCDGCMFFVDGKMSYGNISAYNTYTNESSQIYEFTNFWPSTLDGKYYWQGTFSGLAYHNGRLYFNTNNAVLSCNLDGSDVKTEYLPEISLEESIYGCCKEGTNIRVFVSTIETITYTETLYMQLPIPDSVSFQDSMQAYLNLESEVTMTVGYKLSNMDSIIPEEHLDKMGLLIWEAANAPEENKATYDNCSNIVRGAAYNGVLGRFETTTGGIAAKSLGDSLTFRAYYLNDDGTYTYSRLISNYSPKTYCYNQIENNPDDDVYVTLMAAILNYGSAAQVYFDYNTDNLMNSLLSDELKTATWDGSLVRSDYSVPDGKDSDFVRDASVTSRGGYLNLEGAIDYNFYAKVDFTPEKAIIYYWTEEDAVTLDKLTLENAASNEEMSYNEALERYEGKFEGQAAKEMFNTVYACIAFEKADGEVVYSGVIGYSPERYAYINQNKGNAEAELSRALAAYGDAARTYFNNK